MNDTGLHMVSVSAHASFIVGAHRELKHEIWFRKGWDK
jgi:hypothetical protein